MKRRILLVTGSLDIGGLENVAMDIVRYSDKSKMCFDFLVYGQKEFYYQKEAEELGCHILRIPSPQDGYLKFYKNLKYIISKNGPYAIVHSHTYFNSGLVVMAAKKVNVPCCISHSHSIERPGDRKAIKKIVYTFYRFLLRRYSDKLCACSQSAGEYVFGKKIFEQKGIVISNPIDLEKFAYSKHDREQLRKKFNIDAHSIILGNVGRVVSGKNQRFLIDIMKILNNEKYTLLLVGDGPQREQLENYARKQGVSKKIIFAGEQKNIRPYLSAMDVFLMSSKHEGLGIVLIEAMANGLPCIYEDSAIVDEIKKLPYGFAVEGFDAGEWIKKIDEVKGLGKSSSEKIKENLKEYDVKKLRNMIEKLYG